MDGNLFFFFLNLKSYQRFGFPFLIDFCELLWGVSFSALECLIEFGEIEHFA